MEVLVSDCKFTIHTWRRTQSHVWWRVSTLFVCTISYNLYYYEIFLLIHKKLIIYHTHMSQITKTHSDVIDGVKHGNWYNTVRRGFEFRHGLCLKNQWTSTLLVFWETPIDTSTYWYFNQNTYRFLKCTGTYRINRLLVETLFWIRIIIINDSQ